MQGDLLLLYGDTTCRVNDITARFAGMVHRVDSGQQQLLLGMRQHHKVFLRLISLDSRVLRDDARARTRRVQEDTVEAAHNARELPGVVCGDNHVLCSEAVHVADQTLGTRLVRVVGEDDTGILRGVSGSL